MGCLNHRLYGVSLSCAYYVDRGETLDFPKLAGLQRAGKAARS